MTRFSGWRLDALCIAVLIGVWVVFFWRLFTPVAEHQASLVQGDFSDQFVTFGAYQYARWTAGEVPLWNPYNNGGLPFIADTQAAVFYPPRLATIALAHFGGGWTYHALELEMIAHVLFYTLTMYTLVRRLTLGSRGSHFGGLIAALIGGYGGYMTGYPPLQLALLEAGVWLPLAAIGITEATRGAFHWRWLLLTGFALGLSWMAGHPQTSFFLTYLLMVYFGYRVYAARLPVWAWLLGTASFGVLAFGLVAVTLLPGLEYLILTSRAEFDYEAKAHGFPIRDFIQILIPSVVSQWSPLWVGLGGLSLALAAIWERLPGAWFWGGVALFALIFSLGGNGPLYPALYDVVPGLRYFRGQERAAYLYAHSLAVLAGIGAAYGISAVSPRLRWRLSLILPLLVTAELLIVGLNGTNYAPVPSETHINRNPLIEPVLADTDTPFRVGGLRVLGGNWGSYYQIADIQGISPLFLTGPQQIIEFGLPDERAWELFAVRYVWSDWEALNVPGEVIAEGSDATGPVKLHRLTAPRPFAHLLYDYVVVNSDEAAREFLADPNFDPRTTAILHEQPSIDLPMQPIERYGTTVTGYMPERFTVVYDSPEDAILSLAHVDYPGWRATVDGKPVDIMRAYGGLSALAASAGQHTVEMVYDPQTYRVGAIISAVTWLVLIGLSLVIGIRARHRLATGP